MMEHFYGVCKAPAHAGEGEGKAVSILDWGYFVMYCLGGAGILLLIAGVVWLVQKIDKITGA